MTGSPITEREARTERSRTGWIYRNRRSGLTWQVTGPIHLTGWRLSGGRNLIGGKRGRIVRTAAELDDRSKWDPISWPAAGRCGRCGLKGCKGLDNPDDCPHVGPRPWLQEASS